MKDTIGKRSSLRKNQETTIKISPHLKDVKGESEKFF
ncbi:hypothetical protein G210_4941, partial [Candida maltosa Xu316]